jgi:hypothetical protein
MIKILNKKAQSKKLISILIILIVVGVVLFSMWKFNLAKQVENWIPDFGSFDDGEEIISPSEDSESAITACVEIGEIKFKNEGFWKAKRDESYIWINGEKTDLYWDEDYIKLKRIGLLVVINGRDVEVGDIINSKIIIIYKKFLNGKSPDYQKYEDDLPSIEILKILNNSYLGSGNRLCKGDLNEK